MQDHNQKHHYNIANNQKPYFHSSTWVILIYLVMGLTGCAPDTTFATLESLSTLSSATEVPHITPSPSPSRIPPTPTVTLTPTQEPSATPTPTPYTLSATTWSSDPFLPILLFHKFAPDYGTSTALHVTMSDFRQNLQSLYDSGYSLVSLQDWLQGDLEVPPGRRALAFTVDDLFFNNQIRLNEAGEPDPQTGIGVLWQFYQSHPDFGFHGSLFATIYDKQYTYGINPLEDESLAQVLVWLLEHDMRVYNHTDAHIALDISTPGAITDSLRNLDNALRELLLLVDRPDLTGMLDNMFALSFSVWPVTQAGVDAVLNYHNPEGEPMIAVLEADYIYRPVFLAPPYHPDFNAFKVPRTNAGPLAIQYLIENKEQFPIAQSCELSLPPEAASLDACDIPETWLQSAILEAIRRETCQPGIYFIVGRFFRAQDGQVEVLQLPIWSLPIW